MLHSVTRVDTGALCSLATFPSSPSTIQDIGYCCSSSLSFLEFGFCEDGNHYNVPVCHTYSSVLKGGLNTSGSQTYFGSILPSKKSHLELKYLGRGEACNYITVLPKLMTCSSAGTPDRYRKLDLQCSDNSSLVVFKQLQRTTVDCMLEELMKEDSNITKHCLRFACEKCRVVH